MHGKKSASLEADGCCSSLFEETLSSSSDYIAKFVGKESRSIVMIVSSFT